MPDDDASIDSLPSTLRMHINAEKLRPEPALFARSHGRVALSVATPFLFIALVVIGARTGLLSPLLLIVVSVPLLLAAQRCFQTLVHDLSHKLISQHTRRNDMLGNYLVAGWTGASVPAYRAIHLQHHQYNGSARDPEHISFESVNARGGLLRHCLCYIAGLEALRLINKYYGKKPAKQPATASGSASLKASKIHILVCQLVLFAVFYFIAGSWFLYVVWLYLAVTWNPLLSNLRFLVEHPGETDLTISTNGNWLERLYFAPYNFNFHLEHHLWPNLPPYKLDQAHAYLDAQGYFERHPEFSGAGFVHSLLNREANG